MSVREPRRRPAFWRVAAVGYVVLVACVAAFAFADDDQVHPLAELAAFVLTLPTMVVALPFVYVIGALAWRLREGLAGQPMWPATVTFTLLFALVAVANVALVRLVWTTWLRPHRVNPDELARSRVSPPLR